MTTSSRWQGDRRGGAGGPARRPTRRPRPGSANAPRARRLRTARRARARRARTLTARYALALLSGLILTATCCAWATLRGLSAGLSTNDVISHGPSAPDGAMDILLVGNDSRTDAQGNALPDEVLRALRTGDDGGSSNTDTMILVRVINGGQRVSAVSLPRDTLVRFDDGSGTHKLNGALGTGMVEERDRLIQQGVTDPRQLEVRSRAAGQKFLIKTVEELTGAHIDHYAEVNLLGFYQLTNAVGGVDVCLNDQVNDHYSGAHFRAGPQTIQGSDALAFVRQRHGLPRGDLDRVVRQQVFLSGLAHKLLSTGTLSNPLKLSQLVTAVQRSLILDRGWDILGFAQQMQGITGGSIEFHTIPVELEGPSGHEDVIANVPEVHQFVADLELDPVARQRKQQAEAAIHAERAQTTVNVYNAAGIDGLARSVLGNLTDQGFTQGVSDNADPQASSVHYAIGNEAAAKQVSESLGNLPMRPSTSVPFGTVDVFLGRDYRGPGSADATGAAMGNSVSPQSFPAQPAAWVQPAAWAGPRARPWPAQQPDTGDRRITADGAVCVN